MTSEIINAILPVFLIIFLGWVSISFKFFDSSAKKTCATLVSSYVFPALLFIETATAKPEEILDVNWMLAFFFAMLVIWLIVFISGRYFFKQNLANGAMQCLLCVFPNMGGMGIPFLLHVIGKTALISVARANFVVSITFIPLTIILLETANLRGKTKLKLFALAFAKALKKPMFVAVVVGAIFSFTDLFRAIPAFIVSSIDSISKACIFVSLFTVGLALYKTKIRLTKLFVFNLIVKMLISAIIAWVFTKVFHIEGNNACELIYLLAMPTATIAAVLAIQWEAQPEEATSMYLATTLFSAVTLPVLMYLLQ